MTSKIKKLSLEEKRKRMNDIFFETRDFYQLKDLEKIAPKQKGIVAQTVKEVLQSLVDDGFVNCERIGTSNYYWSFPSTAVQTRRNKISQLIDRKAKLESQIEETTKQIEEARKGREETDERTKIIEKIKLLEETNQQHKTELELFKDMNPELFEQKKKLTIEAKNSVNRWTDNIYTIQEYCSNKFNISKQDFNEQFGITESMEETFS